MTLLTSQVTVADYTLALEADEVLELSALYDPCGTVVNEPKIQQALDRALCMVNSSFIKAGRCGKAQLFLNQKNLIIWIARHLLDTVKARPNVVEDYERAEMFLKDSSCDACEHNCSLTDGQLDEILGQTCDKVDQGFRFNGDCRKWDSNSLRKHQRQLFDNRTVSVFRTDSGCCPTN